MKARAVLTFSALALVPLLVVYFFSVNAINRGIDSWFNVNVGHGLDDALALSRAALSLRMREFNTRTGKLAEELSSARDFDLPTQLERYRRVAGAAELIVVGDHGHIVAASTDFSNAALPGAPADEVLLEARQGRSYVSLDPGPSGGYRVLTATALARTAAREGRVLVASYEVPEQLGTLADGVQSAYAQYGQRVFQRPFLKSRPHAALALTLFVGCAAPARRLFPGDLTAGGRRPRPPRRGSSVHPRGRFRRGREEIRKPATNCAACCGSKGRRRGL